MDVHPTLADLPHELDGTRRLLERVPDDRLDWRPHERSWTLGELAFHLANLVGWQVGMLREDSFDLGTAPPPSAPPRTTAEILETFDRNREQLESALESLGPEALRAPWRLLEDGETIMEMPRGGVLRTVGVSHMIHHRGQLTVYLRLLDRPLPPIYGPTADEKGPGRPAPPGTASA